MMFATRHTGPPSGYGTRRIQVTERELVIDGISGGGEKKNMEEEEEGGMSIDISRFLAITLRLRGLKALAQIRALNRRLSRGRATLHPNLRPNAAVRDVPIAAVSLGHHER